MTFSWQKLGVGLLCTALIALTGGVHFPVPGSPVPVSLNNLFVLLAGLLLGGWWGGLSVLLYVLVGLAGAPVFSDGGHGWSHLMGPTGGYLLGYIVAASVTGYLAYAKKPVWWRDALAACAGMVLFFVFGLPWLWLQTGMSWPATVAAGCTPFIVGGLVKVLLAVGLTALLRPVIFPTLQQAA